MKTHHQLSNDQFLDLFENASLDPELFTHEAHLRLAWLEINRFGIDKAITNVTAQLKNYTKRLGAEDKYNETVTVAAVKAVYHFMQKSESQKFTHFILDFPRLKTHFKELLAQHYGMNIFTNEAAKSIFLEPDRLPFD